MNTADIFAAGLGLTDPWYVTDVEFRPSDDEKGESDKLIEKSSTKS